MKHIRPFIALLAICFVISICAGCSSNQDSKHTYYTKLDELNDKRIGVMSGGLFDKFALERFPDASLLYFEGYVDQLIALRQGKIDAFLSDQPVARQSIITEKDLTLIEEQLAPDKYGFAFQKNTAGNALRDEFNEFMRTADEGRLFENLDAKWFSGDESLKTVERSESLPATNGTIRFGTVGENTPFSYIREGQPIGYEVDLMTRFCRANGYGLEIVVTSFGAVLPALVGEKLDMAACCISITEERLKSVNFSDAHYMGGVVAVVLKAPSAAKPPALATAIIGAAYKTGSESAVLGHFPDAEYRGFEDLASCLLSLKDGQIDYAVMTGFDAKRYSKSDSGYAVTDEPLDEIQVCAAVNKKDTALMESINKLLAEYRKDGTLDKLYADWYEAEDYEQNAPEYKKHDTGDTLRVVISSSSEPASFMRDGELRGYDIELAYRIAHDLNMHVRFIDVNDGEMIDTLISGKGDIILCGLAATEESAEKVLLSAPYIALPTVLVYLNQSASETGFFASVANSFYRNFIFESRWKLIVSGIGTTIFISVCAGIVGIIIGLGFCLIRMSKVKIPAALMSAFTRILQGTPIVVLLMMFYYVIFSSAGISGIGVSVIAFGLNFGAYASEIMLSGINAVDSGQREAALALGYSPSRTFTKIIFPQAARHFIPVLKGEYISLVKMTSVVGYVTVLDLTKMSDIIRSRTYEAFFPLIATAIIYFIISFGLSSLLGLIDIKIDPKHRPRTLKGVDLK